MQRHEDSLTWAAWERASRVIDYKDPELKEALHLTYLFYKLAYLLQHAPNNYSLALKVEIWSAHAYAYKYISLEESVELNLIAHKENALPKGTALTTACLSELLEIQKPEIAARRAARENQTAAT